MDWTQLLVPTLLATGLVFFASSLVHMVIRWHAPDYGRLANEDMVRAALRQSRPAPGQYVLPYCGEPKDMGTPEMQAKYAEGPNAMIWLRPDGAVQLGPFLGKWVLYVLCVSLLVSYVGWTALPQGAGYLQVFRLLGVTAWLAYSWGGPADSIWMGKPWSSTLKYLVDGLVYACLTAGAFAWLWPR